MYRKLEQEKTLPKTSQVTPYSFEKAFEELTRNGDKVIAIVISSGLSGTCASAKTAAENFKGKVFVVDSLSVSVGERLLCQYALRLIEKGKSAEEIFAILEKAKNKICIMAVLETLEYLKKGGRISGAVAFVGGLLNLKPIITAKNGKVIMLGKARGQKKGGEFMNRIVKERGGIDFSMPYGVLWSGLDEQIATKYIEESAEIWEGHTDIPTYILGSTIGTYGGAGVFGLAFFQK